MTLAPHPTVDSSELDENWSRVCRAFGVPSTRVALVHQVHGAEGVRVWGDRVVGHRKVVAAADALWTTDANVLLAVRVADCVPILVAGPGVVAAIHSGWRGTALDITGQTIRAMCEETGVAPAELRAVIGPCISGAAYEVGNEVVEGLLASGLGREDFLYASEGSRPHVDLGAAVAVQLRRAGVDQVARIERCSVGDRTLHSHRRDGSRSGRMAGLVMLCGG